MSRTYHRSGVACSWSEPKPYTDASLRRMKHGPIQSMSKPGVIEQLVSGLNRMLNRRRH